MPRLELPSDEYFVGRNNETIPCPDCGKHLGIRDSAKAYEGDWVCKCWSCGFMWTQEV
jgi:predicted RNA-binding Zn-ribbon protein involved in translation (DUF1610 family)